MLVDQMYRPLNQSIMPDDRHTYIVKCGYSGRAQLLPPEEWAEHSNFLQKVQKQENKQKTSNYKPSSVSAGISCTVKSYAWRMWLKWCSALWSPPQTHNLSPVIRKASNHQVPFEGHFTKMWEYQSSKVWRSPKARQVWETPTTPRSLRRQSG